MKLKTQGQKENTPKYEPVRWTEDNLVMFLDGWAWASELVEKEAKPPAERCWDVFPICLGRKDDIIPILKGEKPIPDDMSPRRIAVIKKILEVTEDERELDARAGNLERGRPLRAIRDRSKNARLSQDRKRIPRGKAYHQVKGVPGR